MIRYKLIQMYWYLKKYQWTVNISLQMVNLNYEPQACILKCPYYECLEITFHAFRVALYLKVSLLQCNYTFNYWLILFNYM